VRDAGGSRTIISGGGLTLDVYGLRIAVEGDWPQVLEALRLDFEWFARARLSGRTDVAVRVERRAPDFDALGELTAAFVTPRNIVYQAGPLTAIDYFGRALSLFDRRAGMLTVQGEDEHLVHEAAYLFLLSRAGRHLDARGLPRLHALALSGSQGGVAVILPSGGGKSTLALRALQDPQVKLLSEDSPLLDRRGILHPFPLRIGINETDADLLPADGVRRIERMEFHPKLVLALSSYLDRIESSPTKLRHLVIGRRSLARSATLERLGRGDAIGPLLRECVVGVGVYQGMEFVLQRGMRDAVGMVGTAFVRASSCFAGLRRADVWRLTLGRDHERNWQALQPLLR
jgi:hypothetical protein